MVENNLHWDSWDVARLCKRAAIVYFFFTFFSWIGQQGKWSWALSMDLLRWTLEVRPGNLKRDSGLQVMTLIMLKVYQCSALACVATVAGSFTAGLCSGLCKIDSCFVCVFVDPDSGGNASSRELQRLKKKNIQLEEENNLLKLKIEVLLDMVYQVALIMPLQSQSH